MNGAGSKGRGPERARGDDGLGLPELIVSIMLLALLSALVLGLFTTVTRTTTRDRAATDSTNVASIGMDELTRVIRSGTELRLAGGGAADAPVFITATQNQLKLYAYIDTSSAAAVPVKIAFSIDAGGRLIETRWLATTTSSPWSFVADSAPSSSRTVARSIPAGAAPLFRYYDAAGAELAVPAVGGFTTAQLQAIAAVRVQLTVQADLTSRADPVTMRNTVGIPNLGISRVGP